MNKTVIRLYDKYDKTSMIGKCYFLVLDGTWDELSDYDFEIIINSISRMSWQHYTSYAVGEIEVEKDELMWSEIMNYEMFEVKIDVDRVKNIKKYKLPADLNWYELEKEYARQNS